VIFLIWRVAKVFVFAVVPDKLMEREVLAVEAVALTSNAQTSAAVPMVVEEAPSEAVEEAPAEEAPAEEAQAEEAPAEEGVTSRKEAELETKSETKRPLLLQVVMVVLVILMRHQVALIPW
jgi:hypothetical protein